MEPIIGSIRSYLGTAHVFLRGQRVVVRAGWRGDGDSLREDDAVRELRPGDFVEVAPLIAKADGSERASWATSDAAPAELGPAEGRFDGPVPDGLLLRQWGEGWLLDRSAPARASVVVPTRGRLAGIADLG